MTPRGCLEYTLLGLAKDMLVVLTLREDESGAIEAAAVTEKGPAEAPANMEAWSLKGLLRTWVVSIEKLYQTKLSPSSALAQCRVRHCGWSFTRCTILEDGLTSRGKLLGRGYGGAIAELKRGGAARQVAGAHTDTKARKQKMVEGFVCGRVLVASWMQSMRGKRRLTHSRVHNTAGRMQDKVPQPCQQSSARAMVPRHRVLPSERSNQEGSGTWEPLTRMSKEKTRSERAEEEEKSIADHRWQMGERVGANSNVGHVGECDASQW